MTSPTTVDDDALFTPARSSSLRCITPCLGLEESGLIVLRQVLISAQMGRTRLTHASRTTGLCSSMLPCLMDEWPATEECLPEES